MPYSFKQSANQNDLLAVARQSGAVFVPMACSGDRPVTFPRAWNRSDDH
jgi:hypothetical protein